MNLENVAFGAGGRIFVSFSGFGAPFRIHNMNLENVAFGAGGRIFVSFFRSWGFFSDSYDRGF